MSRPFFSERAGRTAPGPVDETAFRLVFPSVFARYNRDGYFQGAFGKECVDSGYIAGTIGMTMRDNLIVRFGSERGAKLVPYDANLKTATLDDLFDLIECLHDGVAKPLQSHDHNWDGCGLHVNKSDASAGRREWREEWNRLLQRMEPPYRLTDDGLIELVPQNEGLRTLVDRPTAYGDSENVDSKVNGAVRLFFGRHANAEDRQRAIRELADVLEFLRPQVKADLISADEGALFNIANGFGIRHHNAQQKGNYSKEEFQPWIFHAYLATIDLMARLRTRGV